jgi:signal peptidase I
MTDTSAPEKKRRPWLAGLLSLLMPGLGQFYNGDLRLALVLLIGFLVAAPNGVWFIASLSPGQAVAATVIFLIVGAAVLIFAVIQAILRARRLGRVKLARYQRWYVYVGVYVAMVIWRAAGDMLPIPTLASYNTPASSMMPTLMIGDSHVARTRAFIGRTPERGEVAIFMSPIHENTWMVKRIVGLPGDTIQMREGRLYIDDVLVERSHIEDFHDPARVNASPVPQYVETLPGGASYRILEAQGDLGMVDNTAAFTVPEGHVFMMGDNRDVSMDSRLDMGPVPFDLLRDKPVFLFWADDLSRIGKVIE